MRQGIRLTGIKIVIKPSGRRYVYRRVGPVLVALPDLPKNHPGFLAAYIAAGSAKPKIRAAEGSIAALCSAYLTSHEFKRMAASTEAVSRRTLSRIAQERGAGLLKDLRAEHLRKDIRTLSPGAASNRIKAWRSILRFAVDEGLIAIDPSAGVKAPKGEVTPHRHWTKAEIEGFRVYWPIGSAERTEFEVIFWTGARCVDAVALGWQKVDPDGWLGYVQAKTGGPATCPVRTLPPWASPLAGDFAHLNDALPAGRMLWIVTGTGKPRSVKGLSQWMSAAASAAGLPQDCTAHGLRKARAAALAEAGATASQIGAWTGHASLSEIAHYTRQADQKGILGANKARDLGNRIEKFPKTAD